MAIYGTALLAGSLLLGSFLGSLLGMLLGVDKNIGGVGIAMLALILTCDRLQRSGRMKAPTEQGILFWSAIYIPIVVAMAASRNVSAAISGGPLAMLAGCAAVLACFGLVPLVNRIGSGSSMDDEGMDDEGMGDHV